MLSVETILFSLVSAVVGGLVVAFATHLLTRRRERAAKNREIVLTKMVRAWELMDDFGGSARERPKLENLSEVLKIFLLYGTKDEVEQVVAFINEIENAIRAGKSHVEYGALQKKVRNRIRAELGLPPVDVKNWRFNFDLNSTEEKKS